MKIQKNKNIHKDEDSGSSAIIVNTNYRSDLLNQRICDLNRWLIGVPQGGICSGT